VRFLLLIFLSSLAWASPQGDLPCVQSPAASSKAFIAIATTAEKLESKCEQHVRTKLEEDAGLGKSATERLVIALEEGTTKRRSIEQGYAEFKTLGKAEWPDCRQIEDLRFLADAIRLRIENLTALRASLDDFVLELEKPDKKIDPTVAAKMDACLISCLQEEYSTFNLPLEPNNKCAISCGADQEFLEQATGGVSAYAISETCTEKDAGNISNRRFLDLSAYLEKAEKQMTTQMLKAWKKNRPLLEANLQNLRDRFPAIEAAARKVAGISCGLDKAAAAAELATAELLVPPVGAGSAFYFAQGEKSFLATARHVPAAMEQESAELNPVIARTKNTKEVFEFLPGSDTVDFSQDVALKSVSPKKDTLPLTAATPPKIGDNFIVGGFPGLRKGKFASYRCKFMGFGMNMHSRNAYILDCPAEGFLEGLSGGPLIDENGNVRGIVTTHNELEGAVSATPLALENGQPVAGIRASFTSDACFDSIKLLGKMHRCKITP
jgi:hypothetical protein